MTDMTDREFRGTEQLPSTTILLWAYALAVIAVGCLPALPAFSSFIIIAGTSCLFALFTWRRLLPALLAISLGAGWALWSNQQALQQRLPLDAHGGDFVLQLQVISLPQVRPATANFSGKAGGGYDLRFTARVLVQPEGDWELPLPGQKLDIAWYAANPQERDQLLAGSRWELAVRLKRPRGSANPHTFDYEGWLLQRGIYASGYVRSKDHPPRLLGQSTGLLSLRQALRERIAAQELRKPQLLQALLLGDRSDLDQRERSLLRETGTAHLLAISGLHVGMVAGFFFVFAGLCGRAAGLVHGASSSAWSAGAALAGATLYTLLAGFPLSAQRALCMTAVLLLAWLWRRRLGAGFAYALALALVLTLQPLAFFSPGFWLSFVAVAALLLRFNGRMRISHCEEKPNGEPLLSKLSAWVLGMLRSQWVIVLALLLPSLLFFSGFSASGFLLNLLAIPWLGLLILPWLLLGALFSATALGSRLLEFADWQLDLLMRFLEYSQSALPGWQVQGATASLLLLVPAVLLLLLPAGLPARRLGWLFLLPLLAPALASRLPQPAPGELRVTVLDVGQGLAVALHTPQQRLLYDIGADSASGWSAGSQIIAPYLLGEGIRALDTVIVSHGDRDHAGGLAGLAETLPLARLLAPGRLARKLGERFERAADSCVAGREEQLGDIRLSWLWPVNERVSGDENDHSCVALVQWNGLRLLLTGDISQRVEQRLAQMYADFAPVDLLIAPHHGSRSSSSSALIEWAQPRRVVFSAGFRHHFGHPHAQVVERYRKAGIELFNTAESGALEFIWNGQGREPALARARQAPRFWYADRSLESATRE